MNNAKFGGRAGWFEGRGSVPYHYKIAQTEVLTRQYLEFVEGYWPYFEGDVESEDLLGMFIAAHRQGNGYVFSILPGWEEAPTTMSLRMAARFEVAHERWTQGVVGIMVDRKDSLPWPISVTPNSSSVRLSAS